MGLAAGSDSILSAPYVDSFSCEGQAYGYFADVQNNCEVSYQQTWQRCFTMIRIESVVFGEGISWYEVPRTARTLKF